MVELIPDICISLSILILLMSSYLIFSNKKKLENYTPDGVPDSSASLMTNYYYGVIGFFIAIISLTVIFLISWKTTIF